MPSRKKSQKSENKPIKAEIKSEEIKLTQPTEIKPEESKFTKETEFTKTASKPSKAKGLTRAERLSIGLSAAAIAISIVMPIIGYYLLDPQLQAFRNRARLQISSPSKLIIKDILTDDPNKDNGEKLKEKFNTELLKQWQLDIENVGDLPAKDVQIIFRYPPEEKQHGTVVFDPPFLTDVTKKDGDVFITLKKPIAPQSKIKATVEIPPDQVIVSNEFGESNTINTEASIVRIYNRIQNSWVDKQLIITPKP